MLSIVNWKVCQPGLCIMLLANIDKVYENTGKEVEQMVECIVNLLLMSVQLF